MAKITTSIYLDEEIFKEAKELGLNISKICENSLKMYIDVLRKSSVYAIMEKKGDMIALRGDRSKSKRVSL